MGALDRVQTGFTGPDADGFLDVGYENLAVADAPGLRGTADGVDRALDQFVGNDDLDLYLRQEVHDVFRAPVKLGMALLTSKSLGFRDRDALKPDFLQRFFNLVQLERLDDGFDFLHRLPPGTFIVSRTFKSDVADCAK